MLQIVPLFVLADDARVEPSENDCGRLTFRLTAPTRSVRLVSRSAIPSAIGLNADSRRLGFCISAIQIRQNERIFDIPLKLPDLLDGFHEFEDGRFRWTTGDALLPPFLFDAMSGPFDLAITGNALGEYGDAEETDSFSREIVGSFENLGRNCEFGYVQRHWNVENAGLLRWASIDLPSLRHALESRFADVGTIEQTTLSWADEFSEYRLRSRYFSAHVGAVARCATFAEEQDLLRRLCLQQRLLVRKLLAEIELGSKILVFATDDPLVPDQEIARLHSAIRAIGPATLLFVRPPTMASRIGTVVRAGNGLLLGYIEGFVLAKGPYDVWLELCRSALALHAASGLTALSLASRTALDPSMIPPRSDASGFHLM